jgi:hypothetical protein
MTQRKIGQDHPRSERVFARFDPDARSGAMAAGSLEGAERSNVLRLRLNSPVCLLWGRLDEAEKNRFALRSVSPWRWVAVSFLILSLVFSLTTRTFGVAIAHRVTAKSAAAQAVRQHMDRDAAEWTSPVPVLATLLIPTFYPQREPAHAPLGILRLDENLYNRPPPSC